MKKLSSTKKTIARSIFFCLLISTTTFAQFGDKLKDGIKYYTDSKDSSHFIKVNAVSQVWLRYTENNPLTTVNGYAQANTSDASIRRVRLILSGQLSDRVSFFTQFGQNNLNYLSARKAGSFFHDVTADYAVIKKHLSIGFGLNGWNGPSRFSNISTNSVLVLDPPGFQEVTNDTYDQFVRRLGFYAKGKIGKFDYRLSAAKPFSISTASGIDPINKLGTTFSALPPHLVYQGYIMYQFLDQESNFSPAMTGTYLGKKRVFNIGGGFYYQKNAMYYSGTKATDTISTDMLNLAVDVFYDAPLNKDKGTAISVYASYSNYNFGHNFIKVTGADNPANGANTSSLKAPATAYDKSNYGNALPYLGTGNILYGQVGYKFKDKLFGEQGTLQVFANCQYAVYDRLADPMMVFDGGINWLIKGHNSKFTLDYQNRPYFTENNVGQLKQNNRYGQLVLQYQIAF